MRITDSESFGEVIRNRRKELGYTQQSIAEFTGLSTSFISDLENGKETAEIGKTLMLANLLALDIQINIRGE